MDIEKRLLDVIPESMTERGRVTIESVLAPLRDLLNRRSFPEKPLSDLQLETLFRLLSSMDTDKDPEAARVGEREARVASPFVERMASGFNHGIGRSGHVAAPQPKAPGTSLMQQVADRVAVDAIRKLGLSNVKDGVVLPLATGMSIALVLGALRRELDVQRVLYPRLDHVSPLRAIAFAGLEHVPIPTILEGDAVQADISEIERMLSKNESCAVLATTTFFPPRISDPVKKISRLCSDNGVPLVINNAYGVQSEAIMASICSAIDAGRVDAVVQSSDKNFMAPVGASIVVTPETNRTEWIAETYAGRATAAPVVQTLAAMLAIGREGYLKLREEQRENRAFLEKKMNEIADSVNQRVLSVENAIACAMTLDGLPAREIGVRLYGRRVTGPRVVEKGDFGSCIDNYPHNYLVMNAAIGASRTDVERATTKLYKEVSD
ncbi:MAG: O-phosphoseryl-tRNA(Sec) selenium transferase [Candidatus Thorarchaeota archaeon]